ncbi:MAG: hypothetical protein CVV49_16200 [Spirochaetae bacterium HGW-Spirochaetae-5]|nr:MAG: hypothetical protein CVV49_16200 [Spirochaetae bacterium HGW-Spirochaetae-5]
MKYRMKHKIKLIPMITLAVALLLSACEINTEKSNSQSSTPSGPPDTPVITGIANGIYNTDQTFILTGNNTALIEYTLDGGSTWKTYTVPVTICENGTYNISARQTIGGLTSAVTVTIQVNINKSSLIAPSIDGISSGFFNINQTFTLSKTGSGINLEYSVDGGGKWFSYSNAVTLSDEKTYTVIARQFDGSGNTSSYTTPINVTIDKTVAVPVISGITNGAYYSESRTFTVMGENGANIMYSLNGGATWSSYTESVIITNDGQYTITAKQTDIAGNISQNTQTIIITIDRSIPDAPVITGISGGVFSSNQTFTVAGETNAQLMYTLNGGSSWMNYSSAVILTGENTYSIAAKQIDLAGNVSAVSASVTLTIDKTAPENVTSLIAIAGEGKVTLTWNEPSNSDFKKVHISFSPVASGVNQPIEVSKGTTTAQITSLLASQTYNFTVKSIDEAGNKSTGSQVNAAVLIGTGTKGQYSLPGYTFSMVYVKGGLTFPVKTDNSGTGTVTKGYWIGETEVSYALWSTVYKWATGDINMNGGIDAYETKGAYTMDMNRTGMKGDGSGDYSIEHPVTDVNWREAMMWCNALTEYYNANNGSAPDLECVYYSDSNYNNPIRKATYSTTVSTTSGSQDKPYIKASAVGNVDMANCIANGFRLPSGLEWECAARYIDGQTWTYGTWASGSTGSYTDSIATQMVSWYVDNSGYDIKEVKGKNANFLGLYDMSGNVAEWCFDWHPYLAASYNTRMTRGGAYISNATSLGVGVDNLGDYEVDRMEV